MELIDIMSLIIEQYSGASIVALFITLKGVAAVISNNLPTEKYGKFGKVVDWLASANKKSKLTGKGEVDRMIKEIIRRGEPKNAFMKILNKLS